MRKASEGVQFRRSAGVGIKLPSFLASRFSVTYLLLSTLLTLGVVFSFAPTPEPTRVEAAPGLNEQINFQARILSAQGSLVADGDYNVRFRIYQGGDGQLGGGDETLVWTEAHYDSNGVTAGNDNRVRVVNGYVSVQLNSICGSFTSGGCISNGGVDWNDDTLWLSIDIGGTTQTATPTYDGEMDPFIRFTSVPYAFNSDLLDGLDSTDLVQLGQGEQAANTAGTGSSALISVDQAGTGDLLNLQVSNATVFNLSNAGNLTVGGTGAFQGSALSVGQANTTTGNLRLYDANSANYVSFDAPDLSSAGGNLVFTLPDADGSNTDCLVTDGAGNLSFSSTCTGSGGGGVTSLNTLSGALTIQGTTNEIVVSTSSPNITLSLPDTVILGDSTNAGILQLNDTSTSTNKVIIQTGDISSLGGDLTFTLPVTAGTANQCLKNSGTPGTLQFANCNNGSGPGGAVTLQDAYESGNTITTDSGGTYGDIEFILSDQTVDRNFTIRTDTNAGGYTYISRQDGAGTVDPPQLLLVEDLEANRSIADGIKVQATFGITDGIDVSDAELTNAINIGANAIAGTNFSVTGAGAITSVGINAGAGLIQGTGGLTASGTITFGSLTTCSGLGNGGKLTTDGSGVLSCAADVGGGGSTTTLDEAYNNFGATAALVTIDAAESQTGGLEFALNVADNFTIDLQNTGDFVLQDNNSTFFTISDTGGFDFTLDGTDNPAFTVTNAGSSDVVYNLTGTGNFVIQDGGSPALTVSASDASTTFNGNAVLAANVDLQVSSTSLINFTGNTTAVRNGLSPTGGELFYDTDTDQLLQYNAALSKWQSFRGEYTIVAANDSSQAEQDAADYVADGTADQTEINNALTAAAGGKVVLLPGTYTVDGSISIPSNTELSGTGTNTIITIPNAHNTDLGMIVNGGTSGVKLANIKLNGNRANQTAGLIRGVVFTTLGSAGDPDSGAIIDNVYVHSFRDYGLFFTDVYNSTITHSRFEDNDNHSIYITTTGEGHNTVSDNLIRGGTSTERGIMISGGGHSLVANNRVTSQREGIFIDSPQNVVDGNIIRDSGLTSRSLHISTLATGSTVTNNQVIDGNAVGVALDANDITFIGNTVEGSSLRGVTASGNFLNITGNTFRDNTEEGIEISGDNSRVVANFISNTTSAAAINILGTAANTYVAQNTYDGAGSVVSDAGTGTIYGNQALSTSGQFAVRGANSTNLFSIQNANGVNLFNVDSTNGELEVGDYNGGTNPVAGKLVIANATDANTVTLQVNGATSAGGVTYEFDGTPSGGAGTYTICTSDGNCSGVAGNNLQQAYTASNGGTTPEIKVDATRGGVDIQDADTSIEGSLLTVRESNGAGLGTVIFDVATTASGTITQLGDGTAPTLYVNNTGTGNDAISINATGNGGGSGSGNAVFYIEQDAALASAQTIKTATSGNLTAGGALQARTLDNEVYFIVGDSDVATLALQATTSQTADLFNITSIGGADGDLLTVDINGGTSLTSLQPASAAGNGTNSTDVLTVNGGAGGDTSGTTGEVAGTGSNITLTAGNGGTADVGSTNGSGGSITLQAGAAGAGAGTAGSAGNILLNPNGTGNVGIGTSSPAVALDVVGDGRFVNGNNTVNIQASGGASTAGIEIDNTSGDTELALEVTFNSSTAFYVRYNGDIRTNGQLGFGTGTPDAFVDINGDETLAAWGTNGVQLQANTATFTDNSTAASGTAASAVFNSFAAPTLAATNTSVTTTTASTVFIQGPPTAGTNQTITNAHSLWVQNGSILVGADPGGVFDHVLINEAGNITVNGRGNDGFISIQGSGGDFDAYLQFTDLSTNQWTLGQDDGLQSFVLSRSGTFGTNNVLVLDQASGGASFQNVSDTTSGFTVLNSNTVNVLNVDTTNGELEVGSYNSGTNPVAGKLVIANATDANEVTIQVDGATSAGGVTYQFDGTPTGGTGTYTICTTDNNCSGGSSLFSETGGSPNLTYLTDTASDFAIGGTTSAAASFFFDESLGQLSIGTNESLNGQITLQSSGVSITDPTIAANASGDLTLSAPSGTVVVGSGSGNIELQLDNAADLLIADKTASLSGAYSSNSFTINQTLTGGVNNIGGSVLRVTDTSTSSGTMDYDLILGNAAPGSGTFTGNLLRLQSGGTDRFIVAEDGSIDLTNTSIYNCNGLGNGGKLTVDGSGNVVCAADTGGGTSEFTDGGSFLYPSDLSGAEDIVIGGTTTGAADIWLQATGAAVFNEQGADADFRVEGSGEANALFVQGSDGFVGVGTNTPDRRLEVSEATGGTFRITREDADDTLVAGNVVGTIEFKSNDTQLTTQPVFATIQTLVGQTIGADVAPGILTFNTTSGGTLGGSPVERVRIDNDGNVGIGTAGNNAARRLEVSGGSGESRIRISSTAANADVGIELYNSGTFRGGFVYDDSTTTTGFYGSNAQGALYLTSDRKVGVIDASPDAQLDVQISAAANIGFIIQGAGSQSADYLQVIDSAGTTEYFSIDSSGNIFFPQVGAGACSGTNGGALTLIAGGQLTCSDDDGGGSGAFTSSAGLTQLSTSTDTVTIGSSTAGAKLFVDGDADEVQLEVEANGTQTANVLEVSTNGGTGDMFVIRADGRVGIGDSGPDALFDIGSVYTTTRDLVQIGGTLDFGTDNVSAVNIGTVLDAGNTFNASGLVVDPDLVLDSGETITNYYGVDIGAPTISGTGSLTNAYGLFIRDIGTPATGNNYSLQVGGPSRFLGLAGFGTGTGGAQVTIDTDPGNNLIALDVRQQDTTNNPVALEITNDGTGNSIQVDTTDFIVSGSGQVGIGVAPSDKLSVEGNIAIENGGTNVILLQNANTSSTTSDILFLGDGGIAAQSSLRLFVDSDNNEATSTFQVLKDEDGTASAVVLLDLDQNALLSLGSTSQAGSLRISDGDGVNPHWAGFQAPSTLGSDYTLTLPTTIGSANQCLQNSGTAGVLQFGSCGSGSGAFTSSGGLTELVTTSDTVTIGSSTAGAKLLVNGTFTGDTSFVEFSGTLDNATAGDLTSLYLNSTLDGGTGGSSSASGVLIQNQVILDDAETLGDYVGLAVFNPTLTATGSGSVDDAYGIYVGSFQGYTGAGAVNGGSYSARFDGYTYLNNNVGINTTPQSDAALRVAAANTTNDIALVVDQNDTTNNPVALQIQNAGTGDSLDIVTNSGTSPTVLNIRNDATGGDSRITFEESGQSDNFYIQYDGGDNYLYFRGSDNPATNILALDRDGSTASFSGRLGIGTTPATDDELSVYSSNAADPTRLLIVNSVTSGDARLTLSEDSGSAFIQYDGGDNTLDIYGQGVSLRKLISIDRDGAGTTFGNSALQGRLYLSDGTSNSVELNASGVTTNYALTLPASVGTPNQCLQNSGTAGILTFGSCGSGSSLFTQGTNFAYLTTTADELVVGGSADRAGKLTVINNDAAESVLLLEAASSQSAPLIRVNDSAGSEFFTIDNAGDSTNFFAGYRAGEGIDISGGGDLGRYNTLIGDQVAVNAGSARYNTVVGSQAGNQLTGDAAYNNFFGYRAGNQVTSGDENVYIGEAAGAWNQTGGENVVVGVNAGGGLLSAVNSNSNNTILGDAAAGNLTTGSQNIIIGRLAADNLTTGSNNIVIGYDIDIQNAAGTNTLNIGNTIFGTGINATGTTVDKDAKIGIGTAAPSAGLTVGDTLDLLLAGGDLTTPFGGFGRVENLIANSEWLNNAGGWTTGAGGVTVTADQATAPNGTLSADEIIDDGTGGGYRTRTTGSVSGSTEYTFSIWIKDVDTTGTISIELVDDATTPVSASTTIDPTTTEWRRYSVTMTTGSDANNLEARINHDSTASNSFYAWGAQLEAASNPGPYINTGGPDSAVTNMNGLGVNGNISLNGLAGQDALLRIVAYNGTVSPKIQLDTGNASEIWTFGLDDADSQAFVLSNGSALGTDNVLRIDNTTGASTFQVLSDTQSSFEVQDAGGQAYLSVDSESTTDLLAVKIGAGTDNVALVLDSIAAASEPTGVAGAMYYDSTNNRFRCYTTTWVNCDTTGGGGGGIVNRVNIFAEYAGGTLYADGSSNSGTMAANYDSTQRMNYYEWSATNGSLQDYDIIIHTAVPSDFSSANNTSWYINAYADVFNTAADNEISVAVYEGATQCNTTDNIVADGDLSTNSTWAEVNLGSMASCTLNANDKLRIEIKMSSRSSNAVRVGDIRWDYNN